MAYAFMADDPPPPPHRRKGRINWLVVGAILVIAAIVAVTFMRPSTVSERQRNDKTVRVVLPPPPPPPPVQPVEQPPEPTPTPMDQPVDQAPPPPDAPAQPTVGDNALTAREGAGPSNYGLAVGNGGGTRIGGRPGGGIGGFNRAAYAGYLQGEVKRAVEADRSLRSATLRARAQVWIDASGRIVRVETSDATHVAEIRAALVGRQVRAPDPSLPMPVALSLDIRRSR